MVASLVREQRFSRAWKETMTGYSSPLMARVVCDHYRRGISACLELYHMVRAGVLQPWEEEHPRRGGQPTTTEEQEVLCARFSVDLYIPEALQVQLEPSHKRSHTQPAKSLTSTSRRPKPAETALGVELMTPPRFSHPLHRSSNQMCQRA